MCGERFGPVLGAVHTRWSDAVLALLHDTAADLDDAGLAADDLREVATAAERGFALLDEIDRPRLLHGDLWVPNVMLATGTPRPTITGVFDHDRASWGDPLADWPIFQAARRSGADHDAFWQAYGSRPDSPRARWRDLIYRAAHLGAARLERHRLGNHDRIPASYRDVRAVLDGLRDGPP